MYVGRLAPSPTGHVHLGIARSSLVAWLDARAAGGRLLLRIEDIDGPRTVEGAADEMMRDFAWLGLDWDGPPTFQSERTALYEAALARLAASNRTYPCTCSRKEILAASAPHGPDGPRYPGTCREGFVPRSGRTPAVRFRTRPDDVVRHDDRRYGPLVQNVFDEVGDFVLRRADGLWAYQLAVTVDDLEQGVTDIVRGADLLDSTPRQLLLRSVLDSSAAPLRTMHVPLVLDASGQRLAKRHRAQPIRALERTPEAIVGWLAWSLGLVDEPEPLATHALLARYDPERIRTTPTHLDA